MDSVIYNPQEEYEAKYKNLHIKNTEEFLEELVKKSAVNVEENRETVRQYENYMENLKKLRRKYNLFRFLRVLMCITIVLIPLVVLKMTPKIRALKIEVDEADKNADRLLAEAQKQMAPLNNLFTPWDSLNLVQSTIPLLSFEKQFTVSQETDMKINYDFSEYKPNEQSALEVLSGNYNGNPFLLENKVIHKMGTEDYHGYKTIYWTEYYKDSNGKRQSRTRSQTLCATVTKPKPFYSTQVVLNYCAQGGPELSFSRDATNLDEKSERAIERYVKSGEKRIQRKAENALSNNSNFMGMTNSEFEVLFDALDRTDEVQFRTLFTPLAQTNMVDLILSKVGYGDDFNFIKQRRTNRIISQHSQGRDIKILPKEYFSYSFDVIKENFVGKNTEFFKAVYFDFAPLWAIPMYQERPVHSLKPIPALKQQYSLKECEVLANAVEQKHVVHPQTKTQAILKSAFVRSADNADLMCVTAYSYDIAERVDIVSVRGDDGKYHNIPVKWDDYLPLENKKLFKVTAAENAQNINVMACRNGLCIYN